MRSRRVIGAMTGTSIDGIDLALVEVAGRGVDADARLLRARSAPLGELAPRLRAAATQQPLTARDFATLALDFGHLHAREALALAAGEPVDLAVIHGQTIVHAPPVSWQLVNPFPVAVALRCAVIHDLRQADLAAGGQGAPITPLADWVLYRTEAPRLILNLGGFANATALPGGAAARDGGDSLAFDRSDALALDRSDALARIRGADLCVCNQLLDAAARRVLREPFDRDGAAARRGAVSPEWRARLEARLDRQRLEGRSLGTGDEGFAWLGEAALLLHGNDLLATAASAIGASIARGLLELEPRPGDIVIAGGGARHGPLVEAIEHATGTPILSSDSLGIPGESREAMEIAVLGALADDGVSITLPQVTRRRSLAIASGLRTSPLDPPDGRTPPEPIDEDRIARNTT